MNYFNSAIQTLQNWIKIKSVKSEAKPNMPFGKGVYDMLNTALKEGEALGFKSINYDNYIGEIVFGEGEDKDGLAILCHLDVVPEGELSLWNYPPYQGVVDNGVLYGRGVIDDKGPAVLCLYALKELKDEGFLPSKKIKLILGCDEESGWECIEHYNKVAVMPDMGFTPDGDFPLIYAEKGLIPYKYTFKKHDNVLDFSGGDRINVVCDKACVTLKNTNETIIKKGRENFAKINGKVFVFEGKTAHGSTPGKGDNAIKKALKFLVDIGEFDKNDYINLFEDGKNLKEIKDQTGSLSFSPNVVKIEEDKIQILVDVRHPCTYEREDIETALKSIGRGSVIKYTQPLIVDKNSQLVKALLNIYNRYNGTNKAPLAIGGGTYAKALKCGVAFGPCEIDMNIAHMQNEGVEISYLEKCYKMYKEAIKELAK